MGAIEQALGHTDEAVAHFNAVAESQPKNPAPWIMIARAEITRNEKTCKRALERVLRDCDRDNVYAHVALGNYHATVARELKGDKYKQHVSVVISSLWQRLNSSMGILFTAARVIQARIQLFQPSTPT